jgi:hypothetical protein
MKTGCGTPIQTPEPGHGPHVRTSSRGVNAILIEIRDRHDEPDIVRSRQCRIFRACSVRRTMRHGLDLASRQVLGNLVKLGAVRKGTGPVSGPFLVNWGFGGFDSR